jgi:hypothetical protein
VLASYTAHDLGERINAASGIARRLWLISGGIVLGIGIWSMHYTAMWAFRLPIPVRYHRPTALVSLSMGIAGSMTALAIVSLNTLGIRAAVWGSLFQGAAIAGLHYTAMASMRMPAIYRHSPPDRHAFRVDRHCWFGDVLMADISLSEPTWRADGAESFQRNADGRGHLHHAFHWYGRCHVL